MVFSGSGGQGVITAAIILAEAAVIYEDLNAVQSQSYGAAARGGATRSDVIISDSVIHFPKVIQPNVLVCLTQEAYSAYYPIIRPGGLLLFSTFGPDTLKELRQAWSAVDDRPHVSPFMDMHDIGDMLMRSQFAEPVMDAEYITMTYRNARELMRDIKGIGAHNAMEGRHRGLTGKQRMDRFIQGQGTG